MTGRALSPRPSGDCSYRSAVGSAFDHARTGSKRPPSKVQIVCRTLNSPGLR
jgi:hypothetical protein